MAATSMSQSLSSALGRKALFTSPAAPLRRIQHQPALATSGRRTEGRQVVMRAEKAVSPKAPYVGVSSMDYEGCTNAFAMYDNTTSADFTKIRVEVGDFPSLLRTISWVMNGMDVRVHSADAVTSDDGMAQDTFMVTDLKGKKLSDASADNLAARIQDFVVFCSPLEQLEAEEWKHGPLRVSNLHHPTFTEVLVLGESGNAGFLLEITSVLSGIGAIVHEATLRSDASDGGLPAHVDYDFSGGRFFRFMVTDRQGCKLNASRVASLVYTYDLVLGQGFMPTAAPNMEVYAGGDLQKMVAL